MRHPPAHPRVATRATAVQLMRARLLREGFPRVQMFILVSLTGLAGFGASVAMLAAGVDAMALRYTLAMGVAYIVFLLLLWLWLRTSAADYLDPGWVGNADGSAAAKDGAADFSGGGGSFDGGGASGNVDFGAQDSVIGAISDNPLGAVAEAEEAAVPLVVILLAVGIALSSLFVIWSAPILFAEILVDALLAAGLYRRLRVLEPQHWMLAALKRTIVPFVLTTLTVAAAGWGMQAYAPEVRSLGEVLSSR
ncbi:hypothetical protein [Massilia alkalitolerans]|uniref:hypothetical protein n=1 Tax=Massilia alkalitolerans TaxID=286638 RepID=UPI0028A6EF6B|nr:hypothetical protein [Massilia alkalitolerans]